MVNPASHKIISSSLASIVGSSFVLSHPDDVAVYSFDAGNARGTPEWVVVPNSVEQVQAIVRLARQNGVAIIPRGAGTGLCGAAIALAGGIVISFTRMNRILDIDYTNRTALVEPGVVNLDLSTALAPRNFFFTPDPSSQSASTIGGNIATNSGGPHCLAYGVTSNHVLGLEVVLDNGEALWLGDDVGYDLAGLFVGSEGTFGIITKARVQILPLPQSVRVLLALYNSIKEACRAVSAIIAHGIVPAALEMIDALTLRAVEEAFNVGYPGDAAAVLLIEIDGPEAGLEDLQDVIVDLCEEFGAREVRTAHTPEQRAALWKGRKSAAGAFGRLAPNYYIQDACVARSKLPDILARSEEIAKKYNLQIANVFHAGDGNLHPCILFDSRERGVLERVHEAGAEVMRLCVENGGTISGEHGIGIEKLEFMSWIFSERDLAVMGKTRQAISPGNLFNPCKMIPEGSHCGELAAKSLGLAHGGEMWI